MGPLFPMHPFHVKMSLFSSTFGYSGSCVVGGGLRDVGCSDVRGSDNV